MTQMETGYVERVADAGGTTSASYANTSTSIPASAFVAGKRYLILARSEIRVNALGARGGIRLVHGTDNFDGAEHLFAPTININEWSPWFYFGVWEAVSGEAVTVQTKSNGTARTDHQFTSILAIRLDDSGLVEGTDWHWDERTTDDTLTTSLQTGGSITFTPATGGQNWLVMSRSRLSHDFAADEFVSRLDRTGEVTANFEMVSGGSSAGDARVVPVLWIGALGAVSQTFREQSRRVGTGGATAARAGSAVFALNLSKFDVASFVSTDAHVDVVDSSQYGTQTATVSHTQVVAAGKVLVLAQQAMDPQDTSVNPKFFYNRLQRANVDVFSEDGTTNTYSGANGGRTHYPNPGDQSPGQVWPWTHCSLETLGAGASAFDMDASISAANSGRGVKWRRILALSLDVTAGAPPGGGTSTSGTERNDQKMYQHDYSAGRRRVRVRITDTSGAPVATAAGTQGAISKNGAAFTTTGVGVLVAEESANGLYYAELTAAALNELGSYRYRVSPAGAALFTVVFPVEECPWLWDGMVSAGGANYAEFASPPSYAIPPGSVVRVVDGPGFGESAVVKTWASPRATMEDGFQWATNPTSASRVVVEPGLPPTIPDVNVKRIGGDETSATNLMEAAGGMLVALIQTGANSPIQLVTNLPTVVGGVTTPPNFYKDIGLIVKDGALKGDRAIIAGSTVSGANTILALDPSSPLTGTPAVGVKIVLT